MENEIIELTLEQQLAEAEERGYRRGLNEQIQQKMQEPATWETTENVADKPDEGFRILANVGRSIWNCEL